MKVAFFIGEFPTVSEPFIINQVADLKDRGIEVDIFSFRKGDESRAAERYRTYQMVERTHSLEMPHGWFLRSFVALGIILRLCFFKPSALTRLIRLLFNSSKRAEVLSLKYLFWIAPFLGKQYDLVHCHFGTMATKYLVIRALLDDKTPFITTLYGFDISHVIQEKGPSVYAPLHVVCSKYLVMSNDMRERAITAGFPAERIIVLPVSLPIMEYSYTSHPRHGDEPVQLITVARLVEKKGIDDLLHAIARLKELTHIPFHSTVVGGGPLEGFLHTLSRSLAIESLVTFTGAIPFEEVNTRMQKAHIYVQPSKTAADGDME